MIWLPGNDIPVAKLQLRRKPVIIECTCGSKNTVVLPAGTGRLAWRCDNCPADLVIDFGMEKAVLRKADPQKKVLTE